MRVPHPRLYYRQTVKSRASLPARTAFVPACASIGGTSQADDGQASGVAGSGVVGIGVSGVRKYGMTLLATSRTRVVGIEISPHSPWTHSTPLAREPGWEQDDPPHVRTCRIWPGLVRRFGGIGGAEYDNHGRDWAGLGSGVMPCSDLVWGARRLLGRLASWPLPDGGVRLRCLHYKVTRYVFAVRP